MSELEKNEAETTNEDFTDELSDEALDRERDEECYLLCCDFVCAMSNSCRVGN